MFKPFKNSASRIAAAFALSLTLTFGWYPLTGGSAALSDHASQKHETIFVNLDHSGNIDEMLAVNTFIQPGESVVDYGDYESIINLTNDSVPLINEGRIVFRDLSGEKIFRYQAAIKQAQLPWSFDISYYLDGGRTLADNLAGSSGRLRIVIHAAYNPDAHPYFTQNYMVQIRIPLKMDKAFSIHAPDASIMFAGNTATVAYTLMPNSEQHFTLEADVVDFTMDGIDIAAMKAVLPINEDIEKLESGFEDMAEGTQDLIDGTERLAYGMTELSDGIGEIYVGTDGISKGIGGLAAGLDAFSGGLSDMKKGLGDIAAGSGDFNQALTSMNYAMPQLTGGYAAVEGGMDAMLAQREQIHELALSLLHSPDLEVRMLAETMIAKLAGLTELQGGLRKANEGLLAHAEGIGEIAAQFGAFNQGVKKVADGSEKLNDGFGEMRSAAKRLSSAANSLSKGARELNENTLTLPEDVGKIVSGQKELREGVLLARNEIREFIAPEEKALTVSFVSQNRANAETVQFIMRTPAIDMPQIPESEEVIEQTESIWDRLIKLFRRIADRFM